MAYVAPSTVTTLQTYTSAAHNIIVNDIIDHETRIVQAAKTTGYIISPASVVNATATGGSIVFSAASSVSLNSCFTSTYDNYKVVISYTMSADSTLQLRMRAAGADNSAGTYGGFCRAYSLGGGAQSDLWAQVTTQTSVRIGDGSSGKCRTSFEMMNPAIAENTFFANGSQYDPNNTDAGIWYGAHTTATAFDGLTIFPASGTITGTIRVYAYQNS
jgi:hypothetical protein